MKDKNNQIHIAVAMQNSSISFYSLTVHEDDILGIVSAEEYERLQHESHVNQKDLRAYIDKDGNRKIGAFDNTQPSQYHSWSEKSASWYVTEENQNILDELQKEREINELESQLDQVEKRIMRLERIKQRTDSEEIELDELIDESTELFREIESLKTALETEDEEKEE